MEMMGNIKESARTCGGLFELTERKNVVSSALAGILFTVGWWCIIDVACMKTHVGLPLYEFNDAYHVIGVVSTIAFFMINVVSNGQVRGEGYSDGCLGQKGARIWLFLGFVMGFSALIAATWVLFQNYVVGPIDASGAHNAPPRSWPGVGLFLQNLFIFLGALVYKFGRSEGDI
ncbi:putative Transmembrane protein 50A [Hypsibius exemplaris]|uniref:Transmembrane protein 50A n=1 Tax=Hypsibius exemplaris TaxID=2072580 RepID=A0A1W0X5N0_HYPEX|nr:putative Transmembrane protein 50A [Hypsibius exemplaris]